MRRLRLFLRALAPHAALFATVLVLLLPVVWVVRSLFSGHATGLDQLLAARDPSGKSLVLVQAGWSALVAIATALVSVVLAAPAGYACARLEFSGRRAVLVVSVLALLAPAALVVAPELLAISLLRLPESPALVLPAHLAIALPAAILLATAANLALPDELFLAARLEGVQGSRLFWRVALPAVRRNLVAIAAAVFALSWGESVASAALVAVPEGSTLEAAQAALARAGRPPVALAALGMFASAPAVFAALMAARRIGGMVFGVFEGRRV